MDRPDAQPKQMTFSIGSDPKPESDHQKVMAMVSNKSPVPIQRTERTLPPASPLLPAFRSLRLVMVREG